MTIEATRVLDLVAEVARWRDAPHIHTDIVDGLPVLRCGRCDGSYAMGRFHLANKAELIDALEAWFAEHEHRPEPPRACPGADQGRHVFYGFGPTGRCACGLTEEEAIEHCVRLWRLAREHAEMGWP